VFKLRYEIHTNKIIKVWFKLYFYVETFSPDFLPAFFIGTSKYGAKILDLKVHDFSVIDGMPHFCHVSYSLCDVQRAP